MPSLNDLVRHHTGLSEEDEKTNGLGNLTLRPFGIPPAREAGHAPHSEGELLELLAQSGAEGLIEADEQQIAERGFAFADRRAADVMRPREAIHFVPLEVTVAEAAREAVRSGHTAAAGT